MTTAADILMEARPYIDKGWCQGGVARNAVGVLCDERDATATEWCVLGALYRASADQGVSRAVSYLERSLGTLEVASWNDTPGRTKEDVLDALDRAIAFALDEAES